MKKNKLVRHIKREEQLIPTFTSGNKDEDAYKLYISFKRIFHMYEHKLAKILNVLHKFEQVNVNEMCDQMGQSESITSQQLNKLKKLDIVDFDKNGKEHGYFINYERLDHILIILDVFKLLEGKQKVRPEFERTTRAIHSLLMNYEEEHT